MANRAGFDITGKPIFWTEVTGAGGTLRDDELIMAVVEAAKAWLIRPGVQRRIDALAEAVEALERAEGVSDDTQTAIADFENEGGIIPEDEK